MVQKPNKSTSSQKQLLIKYAKYSAIAFQMVGAFVAFSLGGNWVDKHYNLNFPYFTLLGVLIALVSVFYSIFNLTKDKSE